MSSMLAGAGEMTCVPAPACKAMLAEATRLWPNRSKASDGICASPKHSQQSPTSDHEKGNAADLTDDPANGCSAHVLAEQIRRRRDSRVKYIISNGRICSSAPVAGYPAWAWRTYSGSNAHTKHIHVSIKDTARGDTSSWFVSSHPEPTPTQEDDDVLTPDQAADLKAVKNYLVLIAEHQNRRIIELLEALAAKP